MTFEKTYDVQKNNRLIIKLPERFRSKKRARKQHAMAFRHKTGDTVPQKGMNRSGFMPYLNN